MTELWNPSDMTAGVTLSGGNLIATDTGGGSASFLKGRGTVGYSSGKYYYEFKVTS